MRRVGTDSVVSRQVRRIEQSSVALALVSVVTARATSTPMLSTASDVAFVFTMDMAVLVSRRDSREACWTSAKDENVCPPRHGDTTNGGETPKTQRCY